MFSCHPETLLSCTHGFVTLLSGSHASHLLGLVIPLDGTYPVSQERDMGSTFSESQQVRKHPLLPHLGLDTTFQVEDHVLLDF